MQKSVLGKGLSALLPGAVLASPPVQAPAPEANRDRHPGISFAAVGDIHVNPYQPRRDFEPAALAELSQSIRENGLIQPVIVRKVPEGYQLIAGERRLRAAKMAGIKQVPIVIRRSTDRESLELALVENIQREDLNCIDEALAYFQLAQDFQLTQEEVSQRVGKDRATVANHLRLLRLPEIAITYLRQGTLSFGHGKVIGGLEHKDEQMTLCDAIVKNQLSVRDAEAWIEQRRATGALPPTLPAPPKTPVAERLAQIAQRLTSSWSTRVEIRGNERRGKILLHYSSRQDLERILEAMQTDKQWQAPQA